MAMADVNEQKMQLKVIQPVIPESKTGPISRKRPAQEEAPCEQTSKRHGRNHLDWKADIDFGAECEELLAEGDAMSSAHSHNDEQDACPNGTYTDKEVWKEQFMTGKDADTLALFNVSSRDAIMRIAKRDCLLSTLETRFHVKGWELFHEIESQIRTAGYTADIKLPEACKKKNEQLGDAIGEIKLLEEKLEAVNSERDDAMTAKNKMGNELKELRLKLVKLSKQLDVKVKQCAEQQASISELRSIVTPSQRLIGEVEHELFLWKPRVFDDYLPSGQFKPTKLLLMMENFAYKIGKAFDNFEGIYELLKSRVPLNARETDGAEEVLAKIRKEIQLKLIQHELSLSAAALITGQDTGQVGDERASTSSAMGLLLHGSPNIDSASEEFSFFLLAVFNLLSLPCNESERVPFSEDALSSTILAVFSLLSLS